MDTVGQPSCSYEENKAQDDGSSVTNLITLSEIKTEEIFIKEETIHADDAIDQPDSNDDLDYNLFGAESCSSLFVDHLNQESLQDKTTTEDTMQGKQKFDSPLKVSVLGSKRKISETNLTGNTPKTIDSRSRNTITSGKSTRSKNIHKDFNSYRNYYLSTRRPSTKFTQFSDEYHIFGQYIASSLRSIKDKRTRATTQLKLCNVLHDARISQLQ